MNPTNLFSLPPVYVCVRVRADDPTLQHYLPLCVVCPQHPGAELLTVREEDHGLVPLEEDSRTIHALSELPENATRTFISVSRRFVVARVGPSSLVVNGQCVHLFPLLFASQSPAAAAVAAPEAGVTEATPMVAESEAALTEATDAS
jgi:hypothetical protein